MSDEIDEILEYQLSGPKHASHYNDLTQCPNPAHSYAAWHGHEQAGCKGSHLTDWSDSTVEPREVSKPIRVFGPFLGSIWCTALVLLH